MANHVHGFVDGAYLRERGEEAKVPLPNPYHLAQRVVEQTEICAWGQAGSGLVGPPLLTRLTYYDGRPDDDEEAPPKYLEYWKKIELLPDTHLGFGFLRGEKPRQKAVDTLLAVQMLTGAFQKIFDVALLVSGDADLVPAVEEVKRCGVMVALAAVDGRSLSEDLRRSVDRFVAIDTAKWFRVI